MVDGILIIEHMEKYLAQAKEMHKDMDLACRYSLCFDGERLYFGVNKDDLLD